jgi:predicted dehydrogenase
VSRAGALGVAIVGCGTIAGAYAENLATYPGIELLGATDIDPSRAEALSARHGCKAYASLDELLTDGDVEAVVNLTIFEAHYEVTLRCLEAGRHVYSEKPLAATHEDARRLVAEAGQRGLRLGCSPCVLMGEAQQTAWKIIRDGGLGPVRIVYAEANHGRIETWHGSPRPFYEIGALFDVGVYPLTLVTAMLGPVRSVLALGRVLYPDRRTKDGASFRLTTPDWLTATLELATGALVRLTASFYVPSGAKQGGIEFHGDQGSLHLSSWQRFDASVELAEFGRDYSRVPLLAEPYPGTEWGRGILDMAQALRDERPHRASSEQAAHVVEVLCATMESIRLGQAVAVHSDFRLPEPMAGV